MRTARLEFFGMHKLVEVEDRQHYFELIVPRRDPPEDEVPKESINSTDKTPTEIKYGRLIFEVTPNSLFGYFDGEPYYKLKFSHFEISE
ncbi:MAG: hypothetical protein GPJ50_06110 [Candidatus Heimdallarchaeota archaeon]|nr:hypothetical protein [Candidatus Heimdallarchaeota archaeon]